MGIPVLLVATTTRWLGTARIPKVLTAAGFEVSLLTPRHSLAEASRFIAKIGYLADHTTPAQWIEAFAAAVKATAPRLVIPCDDMAFRLLAWLVSEPPIGVRADLHLQLAALVRDSLGDPAHYRASVDKTLLPPLAEALGVRVPAYEVFNVDVCAALFAALEGTVSTSRTALDADEKGISVHFPQEWLRDPQSPYLRRYVADVPWDEPELLEALLKLRH